MVSSTNDEGQAQSNSCCKPVALAAIAMYSISGPLIIVVNKSIVRDHGLKAPGLVSSMGMIFTAVVTRVLSGLGKIPITTVDEGRLTFFSRILPVGVCTAASFLFGNMAYEFLDPGFLQMMKAGTPALLLFALICLKVERISIGVAGFALTMVFGSVLAAFHTPHVNVAGVCIQLVSQMCEVLQCVTTQIFLQQLHFTALDAGYYIAPTTASCCLILSCFLEFPKLPALINSGDVSNMGQIPFLLVLSGIIGVAVNFSSFLVIQYISSLMAKLVTVARSAALVLFFIVVQGEEYTMWQLVGYSIALCAFAGYSWQKAGEKGTAKNTNPEDVESDPVRRDCGGEDSDTGSIHPLLETKDKPSSADAD